LDLHPESAGVLGREDQLVGVAEEDEQDQEEDRGRGEHVEQLLDEALAIEPPGEQRSERQRDQDHQAGRPREDPLFDLDDEYGEEQAHQREVKDPIGGVANELHDRLDQQSDQRWQQSEADREDQDVALGVLARDPEVGVLAQQVEQRLHEREGPERGEMGAAEQQLSERVPAEGLLQPP
jgi:hypothetical protein